MSSSRWRRVGRALRAVRLAAPTVHTAPFSGHARFPRACRQPRLQEFGTVGPAAPLIGSLATVTLTTITVKEARQTSVRVLLCAAAASTRIGTLPSEADDHNEMKPHLDEAATTAGSVKETACMSQKTCKPYPDSPPPAASAGPSSSNDICRGGGAAARRRGLSPGSMSAKDTTESNEDATNVG